MLQLIIDGKTDEETLQLADDAINAGCRWLQLCPSLITSAADSDNIREEYKAMVEKLIPTARDNDAFLMIEDDVDLVEATHVHGVVVRDGSRGNLLAVRERMGAEAVIGAYVPNFEQALELRNVDVDYLLVPAPAEADPIAYYKDFSDKLYNAGLDIHLVAAGDFAADQLPQLLTAGCAGVALTIPDSFRIAMEEKPLNEAVAKAVEILANHREALNAAITGETK